MKLSEVRAYGKAWQDRLKLSEWEIQWRWMTKAETTENPSWNGFCQWECEHKLARIAIAKDSECIPHTVLHECLHIRLEGYKSLEDLSDLERIPVEVTINALTGMCLKLEGLYSLNTL